VATVAKAAAAAFPTDATQPELATATKQTEQEAS
jgi:hypothetical protein